MYICKYFPSKYKLLLETGGNNRSLGSTNAPLPPYFAYRFSSFFYLSLSQYFDILSCHDTNVDDNLSFVSHLVIHFIYYLVVRFGGGGEKLYGLRWLLPSRSENLESVTGIEALFHLAPLLVQLTSSHWVIGCLFLLTKRMSYFFV